jgi:hypothetical protein
VAAKRSGFAGQPPQAAPHSLAEPVTGARGCVNNPVLAVRFFDSHRSLALRQAKNLAAQDPAFARSIRLWIAGSIKSGLRPVDR